MEGAQWAPGHTSPPPPTVLTPTGGQPDSEKPGERVEAPGLVCDCRAGKTAGGGGGWSLGETLGGTLGTTPHTRKGRASCGPSGGRDCGLRSHGNDHRRRLPGHSL